MNGPQFTVVLALGRNIEDAPMSPSLWLAFCEDTQAALVAHGAAVVQRPRISRLDGYGLGLARSTQVGVWNGAIIEDCCTFIAFVSESHLFALRHDCGIIRDRYAQEAMAFIAAEGIAHVV